MIELQKLSAAATKGVWTVGDYGIDAQRMFPTDKEFVVVLVNAYRNGDLVERSHTAPKVKPLEWEASWEANTKWYANSLKSKYFIDFTNGKYHGYFGHRGAEMITFNTLEEAKAAAQAHHIAAILSTLAPSTLRNNGEK
jgi:hypothetical protein